MHCSSQVVPFLAVGIHMCYTTTSRFVDTHQLLQSSLQQLLNNAGAPNASAAPSTVSSTDSRTTSQGRRDNNINKQARRKAPLVASIVKLAAIKDRMAHKQAKNREQLKEMEDKRASLEMRQIKQKRKFEQICELRDLACRYRRESTTRQQRQKFAVLQDFLLTRRLCQ